MPNKKREIHACIDLGSSYFRLLVAEGIRDDWERSAGEGGASRRQGISPRSRQGSDEMRVLLEEKAYVGWGEALARDGRLLPGELERAGHALSFLVTKASGTGCRDPVIVGTNTLRHAINWEEALERLHAAAPLRVSILSQRGEAALGFLGASTIVGGDAPTIQIDVGGTSTEIAWGRAGVMNDYIGLPWGTHAARAMIHGRSPRTALAKLRALVFPCTTGPAESILYRLLGMHGADTILCTGGTAVSLAVILNYTRRIRPLFRERETVSKGELEQVLRRLWGLFETGRQHRLPLEMERVNLLLPGMILLTLLVREMRLPAFSVTSRDIRWGGIIAGDHLTEYSLDGRGDR
jgi:exopolyphosphatase/pppGpp-phosphohydrolase